MTLQVLPPEMLEAPKERIETKEPQPYWKPSTLKDGESEEFRLLGCYETGHAVFEATHGTAPKYADQDKVNPGSVILSGVLMFEYLGWNEAAAGIIDALEKTIAAKTVTYDFERLMEGATLLKCSGFADHIIKNMG